MYGQFHSCARASVMGTSAEDQAEKQTVVCTEMASGSKTEGVKFQCNDRCMMHRASSFAHTCKVYVCLCVCLWFSALNFQGFICQCLFVIASDAGDGLRRAAEPRSEQLTTAAR